MVFFDASPSGIVICEICSRFDIDSENIDLELIGGFYHWTGLIGDLMPVSNTGNGDITSHSLDSWVDDFEFRINEWKRESGQTDINQAVNELKKARGLL